MLNARTLRHGLALAVIATSFTVVGGCSKDDRTADHGVPPDAKIEAEKPVVPNAAVHVAAGDLAVGQGKREDAMRQYDTALKMDPNDSDALFKLATLQTYARNFDAAIPLWQRYTKATKDSASGWSDLGRCHELAGHWKDAEVSYLEALKRDPNNMAARVNYGILLAKRERSDEAEAQLSKVLVPAEVQYNLGSVCELRQDFAGARIRYEKALAFDPALTAARQRLDSLKSLSSAAD